MISVLASTSVLPTTHPGPSLQRAVEHLGVYREVLPPKVLTRSLNQTTGNAPVACETTTKTYMSNYMKSLSALALVSGFAASCCFELEGSTAAANEEILFRVKVSDVGLQNSSLANSRPIG